MADLVDFPDFNSSLILSNIRILASRAIPTVSKYAAIPESVKVTSRATNDSNTNDINGMKCLQTIISPAIDTDSIEVMDSIKTIYEYYTDNVQNFSNITSGSITLGIFDLTRNVCISHESIDLSTQLLQWNQLAQTGYTSSNSLYKSHQFYGLINSLTSFDCIWQFRIYVDPSLNNIMKIRMHGLQKLFYQKNM